MKILLVTGPTITLKEPFCSGIEAFIVAFANQLVQSGHQVDVIARDAEPNTLFNVINLDANNKKRHWTAKQYERTLIRSMGRLNIDGYDIIHYNLFIPALYKLAATFDKPSVLTLHSPVDRRRRAVYKRFAKRSNVTFVAVSERIKEQWELALDAPVPMIRNGIDLERWPLTKERSDYLFWSARINKEKNTHAAIELAIQSGRRLKIAGRITDQKYFDTKVQPLLSDDIQYVGHVTQQELSQLAISASAFLATATWQEPFGFAVLEMLASGVPVVGFESAIPPDLRGNGVSTVASTDWRDLLTPLTEATNASPATCRGFATTMSVEKMTDDYINLYRSIIQQPVTLENGLLTAPDSVEYSY